jgi:acetyl-CoA synthetase
MARLHGGFYRAQGRADDTMNLGGIKVSSMELERIIEEHEEIYESAAVSVQPEGEGAEKLVIFAVLREPAESAAAESEGAAAESEGATAEPESTARLATELGRLIARRLNPLFKVHDLVVVDALPRTASNKLMRRTLRVRYVGRGEE